MSTQINQIRMSQNATKFLGLTAQMTGLLCCIVAMVICMTAYWLEIPEPRVQESALLKPFINLAPDNFFPADYNFLVAGYSSGVFYLGIGILLVSISIFRGPAPIANFVRARISPPFDLLPTLWAFVAVLGVGMFMTAVKAQNDWGAAGFWFACLFAIAALVYAWDLRNKRVFLAPGEMFAVGLSIVVVLVLPKIGDMPLGRAAILALGLCLLALGPRWRAVDGDLMRLLGLILLAFCLYNHDYMHWRHSTIGDDLAHYASAEAVCLGRIDGTILDWEGTYRQHPLSAAYLQAGAMRLYGIDAYGWRMSETVAVLLASLPLYFLARGVSGPRAGLVATVVFLFSPHLMAFTRIGYNQCQGLVAFLLPMACAVHALRRQSLFGFFCTGVSASLAFYTFGLAIPLMVLTPLLLVTQSAFRRPNNIKWALLAGLAFFVGCASTASPRIMDRTWIHELAVGMTALRGAGLFEILTATETWCKTLHALTSFFSYGYASQYMSGSLLSPVAALLAALGIGLVIGSTRRVALWLLAAWVATAFASGGLSPYHIPPNTRIFILVPIFALFAGIGFRRFSKWIVPPWRNVVGVSICFAIIVLSYYQFHVLSPRMLFQSFYSYVVRDGQEHPEIKRIWLVSEKQSDADVGVWLLGAFRLDKSILRHIPEKNIVEGISLIAGGQNFPMEIIIPLDRPKAEEWGAAIRSQWPQASEERVIDPAQFPLALIYKIQKP